MICTECSTAAQVPGPLATKAVVRAIVSVIVMVVGVAVVLLPYAVAALVGGAFVAVGYWFSNLATFRAVIRRNARGVPLFAYHFDGMPHEHLANPHVDPIEPAQVRGKWFGEAEARIHALRNIPFLQLRIGGWFRRLAILGCPGTRWEITTCWRGLLEPVTMRHRDTGETVTSSAPHAFLVVLAREQEELLAQSKRATAPPEREKAATTSELSAA
ncbi:hypothetical protein HY480_03605 [Candidatus Uhrbacteria bacterium]|nr:hypothetical protein [Candidatus Uhrbacteria bacterium]